MSIKISVPYVQVILRADFPVVARSVWPHQNSVSRHSIDCQKTLVEYAIIINDLPLLTSFESC
jgi:hypothetical protein